MVSVKEKKDFEKYAFLGSTVPGVRQCKDANSYPKNVWKKGCTDENEKWKM